MFGPLLKLRLAHTGKEVGAHLPPPSLSTSTLTPPGMDVVINYRICYRITNTITLTPHRARTPHYATAWRIAVLACKQQSR